MSRSQCLCGIAIALAVIFGPTSAAAEIEQNDTLSIRPFEYVPSLDTTPVEIQIRGVRWRVPRNFLETATLGRSSQVPGWSAVYEWSRRFRFWREQLRKRCAAL